MKTIGWMKEVKNKTFSFAGRLDERLVVGFLTKSKKGVSLEIRIAENESEEKIIKNSRIALPEISTPYKPQSEVIVLDKNQLGFFK